MKKNLDMIRDLVNHIEENLAYEVNVINLAKSFDISPWHFQRLFKSIVGDSLGGYIRGRRLSTAANLLLNTKQGIINIAFDVGFNSHEAFTRSFKSYFKYSPKKFRAENPAVLLNQKSLLTMELFDHIREGIENDPMIMNRKEQWIVGFDTTIPSPFFAGEKICEMISTSWFKLLDQQIEVKNRIPQTYYGLSVSESGNFTEDTLSHIAGVPVYSKEEIPDGMVSHLLPKQQVAVFDILTSIEEDTVKKTIDYIYGYWLPNSPYIRGYGNDYELFENVVDFMTPTFLSKYVVPIVPKK